MSANDNNAVISLEGDFVVYKEHDTEVWRVSLPSVAIIGEYTTANGPYVEDYYLVFVITPEKHQFHASYYAKGWAELVPTLEDRLGDKLVFGLTRSTELASHCMWPPELVGQELFRFTPVPPGGGWNRLRRWLHPLAALDYTMEVERYLA